MKHRPLRHPMETTFYVKSGGWGCRCDDCRRANREYQRWYMGTHPDQVAKRRERNRRRTEARRGLSITVQGQRIELWRLPAELMTLGLLIKEARKKVKDARVEERTRW